MQTAERGRETGRERGEIKRERERGREMGFREKETERELKSDIWLFISFICVLFSGLYTLGNRNQLCSMTVKQIESK